jgi:integrase
MAWAERLPSGRYRAVYRDAHGARRSAGVFTHKPKAERAAAAAEQTARNNPWTAADSGHRTWGEWCTEWWPTRMVEPGTAARGESPRDVHLIPKWGTTPIGSITRHDVRTWVLALTRTAHGTAADGRVLSPSTVQRIVHLFSASMEAAVDAGIITVNPAARVTVPKAPPAQERFLTHTEFEKLVDEMPTLADWLIAQMLVNTGLRWGELAGLHWNRLHLDRGLVYVVETYDEVQHRIKPYPKGRRARDVPIPPWLVDQLADLDRSDGPCPVPHTTGKCRSGLVLTTPGGAVLRDTNWSNRVWRPAVARAGLDGVRPHDLRHTYASWLLQAGVSLARVGKLMGHMSPVTTQKYAWLEATDPTEVVAALPAPRLPHEPG